jgi:putative membrane protein
MRQRFLIIAPLLLGAAACGSKTTADQQTAAADPEATATASSAAVGGDNAQLPLTAQAFIDAVTASDKFEIQSARIVQATGPGQPLTAFTQMMLRDHQNSTNELRAASNQAGGARFDDQKLTDEQKADLDALRGSGPRMAALYKTQQIAAHQKALAVLKTYAGSGDNQALMTFAGKAIPVVTHHLEEVQKLP